MKNHHYICYITSLLFFCILSCTNKKETRRTTLNKNTFDLIIQTAKKATEVKNAGNKVIDGATLIPLKISSKELRVLAKRLRLCDWSLDTFGEAGTTVLEQAFFECLYKLSEHEDGYEHLISLLTDEEIRWDGGHSLTLQDAIVQCGKKAVPALHKVSRKKYLADECIKLIEAGYKTAY